MSYSNQGQCSMTSTITVVCWQSDCYIQADGKTRELVTPPLDGTILPGVTRDSVLQLTRSWGEFEVSERQLSIKEIKQVLSTVLKACALMADMCKLDC